MSYKVIRQAIYDKIEAEKDKIAKVYLSPTSSIDEFPAVIVEPTGHKSEVESTKRRERKYLFDLTAYYSFNNGEEQETSGLALDEVADELITIFDKSDALVSAGVNNVSPVDTEWGYFETDEGVYRYVRMTISCRVVGQC